MEIPEISMKTNNKDSIFASALDILCRNLLRALRFTKKTKRMGVKWLLC